MEKITKNPKRLVNPFEKKEVHLLAEDLRKTMRVDREDRKSDKREVKSKKR